MQINSAGFTLGYALFQFYLSIQKGFYAPIKTLELGALPAVASRTDWKRCLRGFYNVFRSEKWKKGNDLLPRGLFPVSPSMHTIRKAAQERAIIQVGAQNAFTQVIEFSLVPMILSFLPLFLQQR